MPGGSFKLSEFMPPQGVESLLILQEKEGHSTCCNHVKTTFFVASPETETGL